MVAIHARREEGIGRALPLLDAEEPEAGELAKLFGCRRECLLEERDRSFDRRAQLGQEPARRRSQLLLRLHIGGRYGPPLHTDRDHLLALAEQALLPQIQRGAAFDRGHGEPQHLSDRSEVIRRQVPQKREQLGWDAGEIVEAGEHRLDAIGCDRRLAVVHREHDADGAAPAELAGDAHAGLQARRELGGNPVREGLPERDRDRDVAQEHGALTF